jgi:MoxR-like ATPase
VSILPEESLVSFYYKGTESGPPSTKLRLEQVVRNDGPEHYVADEPLAVAVNVALVLGKPLLLTGEPGTGKTELARHVALALGLSGPERYDTKSTSHATELFYRFDNLARFHAANMEKASTRRALDFITWGSLGEAILQSLEPGSEVLKLLGRERSTQACRTVVLIDEIDKAPRDFPNDLLDAIQNLRFGIRELETELTQQLKVACGGTAEITANGKLRPIVIITSNSEKNLPAAFLRRCVYYHIPAPTGGKLRAIIGRRIQGMTKLDDKKLQGALEVPEQEAQPLLRSAVSYFESLRNSDLSKPPSTAELIDWIRYLLRAGAGAGQELKELPSKTVLYSLGVLVKSLEDLEAVSRLPLEPTRP